MARKALSRIGLISDTHDLVRPEALAYLTACRCDAIIHAGDICEPQVLEALGALAPVTAVRGNNDIGGWADALPHSTLLTVQQVPVLVVHDIADAPRVPGFDSAKVVVTGHSHKPLVERRGDVLYVNPGSAGRRRFKLPISAGLLVIDGARAEASWERLVE